MKRTLWLAALAALALAASGCEQQKATQMTPPAKPAVEEPKAMPQETTPALPAPAEKPEPAVAAPAVPPPATEAMQPAAPAPAPKPVPVPAAASPAPPKTVVYKATNGPVTFDHPAHSSSLACNRCHTSDPPAKIPLDKDKAHQLCKGCHQEQGAGPTQCSGCHLKG
jgi:hypothetical protein